MKRILLILMVLVFLFSGCAQSNQAKEPQVKAVEAVESTPSPTPTPTDEPEASESNSDEDDTFADVAPAVDVVYQSVTVCDDVITLDIPDTLIYEEFKPGTEYFVYGYIINEYGEEIYCRITITRCFQIEEPMMDYEMLDSYVELLQIGEHGHNTEIERIDELIIDDFAIGYYSTSKYPSGMHTYKDYICNIKADEIYYNITISAQSGLLTDSIASEIFHSISFDQKKNTELSNSFEMKIENGRYYSSRLEGASIDLPGDYNPTMSAVLWNPDAILAITKYDNNVSIAIDCFLKELNPSISSLSQFRTIQITELLNRGFIDGDDLENISSIKSEVFDSHRQFLIYPVEEFAVVEGLIEYEDAFYAIEMTAYAGDEDTLKNALFTCYSFTAPGNEILPE